MREFKSVKICTTWVPFTTKGVAEFEATQNQKVAELEVDGWTVLNISSLNFLDIKVFLVRDIK